MSRVKLGGQGLRQQGDQVAAGRQPVDAVDLEESLVFDLEVVGPPAAAFAVPMKFDMQDMPDRAADWPLYISYLGFSGVLIAGLLAAMVWLFETRWRVAE